METYSVEKRDGSTILRGSVPINHFAALAKTGSPDDVIDIDLARRFNANFVSGHPKDIEALRKIAPHIRIPAAGRNLSPEAIHWLETGERGSSSNALFDAAMQCSVAVDVGRDKCAQPHDPADFVRCRSMVNAIPAARAELSRAATVSPQWARVVERCDVLCSTLDSEMAKPENSHRAHATYALLQKIVDEAQLLRGLCVRAKRRTETGIHGRFRAAYAVREQHMRLPATLPRGVAGRRSPVGLR